MRLALRYAEPQRHYHTWTHILACFDARDALESQPSTAVDLALLFHDAVYDPLAADNEERSAELLIEEGRRAWMDERVLQRARRLIGATKHDGVADDEQACVVVDSDLSILGTAPDVFAEYERQVRAEYAMVDDASYAAGRAAVLRSFLGRDTIYATRRRQRLWEANARRTSREA